MELFRVDVRGFRTVSDAAALRGLVKEVMSEFELIDLVSLRSNEEAKCTIKHVSVAVHN